MSFVPVLFGVPSMAINVSIPPKRSDNFSPRLGDAQKVYFIDAFRFSDNIPHSAGTVRIHTQIQHTCSPSFFLVIL